MPPVSRPTSFRGRADVGFVVLPAFTAAPRRRRRQPQATTDKPAEPPPAKPSLQSHRLSQPPIIDGVLDDDAWREGPVETGEWLSYNPLYGRPVPQKTKVWIGHDTDYLYFAFQCDDPDPSGDQDVDHPPRQHLVRRLGRHQPRRARHRAALVSPDGQSERRAARHAEHRVAAARTSRPTTCGTAPGAGTRRATPSRCACRCRRFASRAAPTSRWGFSSGAGSAAPASRSPGRRSSPASGCSRSTRRSAFGELRPRLIREIIPSTTYARTEERDAPSAAGAAPTIRATSA